jgi:hypothetical protein
VGDDVSNGSIGFPDINSISVGRGHYTRHDTEKDLEYFNYLGLFVAIFHPKLFKYE